MKVFKYLATILFLSVLFLLFSEILYDDLYEDLVPDHYFELRDEVLVTLNEYIDADKLPNDLLEIDKWKGRILKCVPATKAPPRKILIVYHAKPTKTDDWVAIVGSDLLSRKVNTSAILLKKDHTFYPIYRNSNKILNECISNNSELEYYYLEGQEKEEL